MILGKKKTFIIGIAGAFGSGKSTAADFLKDLGFTKISLVQFLEKELDKGERHITRKLLQDLGNKWREKFGGGVLAQKALTLIKEKRIKKVVVEGFRNVKEIEVFEKEGNFKLVAILVNRDIRFRRLKDLKRREKLDWDLFQRLDDRDLGVGEGRSGLQVALCIARADIFIENNGAREEFRAKLQGVLKKVGTI